jgi:hypothetical protein
MVRTGNMLSGRPSDFITAAAGGHAAKFALSTEGENKHRRNVACKLQLVGPHYISCPAAVEEIGRKRKNVVCNGSVLQFHSFLFNYGAFYSMPPTF